jgi:hypothetical protein
MSALNNVAKTSEKTNKTEPDRSILLTPSTCTDLYTVEDLMSDLAEMRELKEAQLKNVSGGDAIVCY